MESLNEKAARHKKDLKRMRKEAKTPVERNRAAMMVALAAGLSKSAVARVPGHARSTVIRAVQAFEAHGLAGLADGRVGVVRIPERDKVLALLPELVAKQPPDFGWQRPTWSVELVGLEVFVQTEIRISRTHMGRLLHEVRCRRVRPKPAIRLTPPDAPEQLAKLEAELDALPPEDVVLYEDEVDVHLNPSLARIGRRRASARR